MSDPLKQWGLPVLLISLFLILVIIALHPYAFFAGLQPIHLPLLILAIILLRFAVRFRRSLCIIWWRKRLLNWQIGTIGQRIHKIHAKIRQLEDQLFQNDLLSWSVRHEGERTLSLWQQQIKLLNRMTQLLQDHMLQLDGLRQDIKMLSHLKKALVNEPQAQLSMMKVEGLHAGTLQKINRRLLPIIRKLQNSLHPAAHQETLDKIDVQLTTLEEEIKQPQLAKNSSA